MKKIHIPSASAIYVEQKVYNIVTSPDISVPVTTIVAPDVHLAVQAFSFLYPEKDIINIGCIGPCVALYPASLYE